MCAGVQCVRECDELGGRLCIHELLPSHAIFILPYPLLEGAGKRQQGR